MINHKKMISIDELHLETTIQLCKQEQSHILQKQNTSLLLLFNRYVMMDIRMYASFALIGFLLTLLFSGFHRTFVLIYVSIYFFSLGLFALYEFYKNAFYHTTELLSSAYLHPGRCLLMKNASIACMECILFLIFMMLPMVHQQITLTQGILCFLVPLYALQIAMIYLLPIIKGYYSALVLYIVLYGIYFIFVNSFSMLQITSTISLLILTIIISLYLISMYQLYLKTKKQGGNTYGITFGTY